LTFESAVREPSETHEDGSESKRGALLFAARQALEALFAAPDLETRLGALRSDPDLQVPAGVFVSLHRRRDGRLRGCIGAMTPQRSLLDAVIESAIAAAQRDPRFKPLQARELADLDIEISVLGPLQRTDPADVVVGRDGLVVTRGLMRGVLLPQVPREHGWTAAEFLAQTCVKAGLDPDAWQHGAVIERFTAEVFSETDRRRQTDRGQ
jgi:AmmeMemoRadiSam system protein A